MTSHHVATTVTEPYENSTVTGSDSESDEDSPPPILGPLTSVARFQLLDTTLPKPLDPQWQMRRDFLQPSIFATMKNVEAIDEACGGLCRDGYKDLLLLGVTGPDEFNTSHKPPGSDSSHYLYLYSTLFVKMGFKLPFSNFICETLSVLNISLFQLHPNSWGFLRSFEIICKNLGITPSYTLSFYFYWNKGFASVFCNLLSFTSFNDSGRFHAFRRNFHGSFNRRWFKVFDNPGFAQLTTYVGCTYKFPLYWTESPKTAIKIMEEMLTPDEIHAVEFLKTLLIVSCAQLFEAAAKDKVGEFLETGECPSCPLLSLAHLIPSL